MNNNEMEQARVNKTANTLYTIISAILLLAYGSVYEGREDPRTLSDNSGGRYYTGSSLLGTLLNEQRHGLLQGHNGYLLRHILCYMLFYQSRAVGIRICDSNGICSYTV